MNKSEKNIYFNNKKSWLVGRLTRSERYYCFKYVKLLRLEEHFFDVYSKNKKRVFAFFLYYLTKRRKNILGNKMNIHIPRFTCGEDLNIWHGGVYINSNAKIGKCAVFHGHNCVGNKTAVSKFAPTIGDNVEFGFGCSVIGNISVGDNTFIGAGAVVTHNFSGNGLLKGVPASNS